MILALALGAAIGVTVGMVGGGGSVLAVPVFVYALGLGVPEATTASLMVVGGGAVVGGLGHARAGRVCWPHAASLTVAAIPGVVAGTLLAALVAPAVVLAIFALAMFVAAHATWRRAGDDGPSGGSAACPPLRLPRDLAAGALVGVVTGFLGIGGGFLIVPMLALALAFTLRTAVGTSLVIIAGVSFLGLAVHLLAGRELDLTVAAAMTAACMAGAGLGARLAGRVSQHAVGRAFAVIVAAVAVYLLIGAALGGPAAG